MSDDRTFVDTNGTGVLSIQVLQELYVTLTRKIPKPVRRAAARDLLRAYSVWLGEPADLDFVLRASEIEQIHRLSFWDSLILAAARAARATVLLSEDLGDGQIIEGIRVENPFRAV